MSHICDPRSIGNDSEHRREGPAVKGLMQEWPLLVHRVLDHASRWHGERQVISRSVEGTIHRIAYRELDGRAQALASAARRSLMLDEGSVVATLAWNTWRHLEIWY